MRKGTSTLEEVLSRKNEYPLYKTGLVLNGGIYKISKSEIKEGIFIVTFRDGTQANITKDVLQQLNFVGTIN